MIKYVYLRKLYIKWRSWAGETYFYAFLKNQPYYLPGLQISEFLLSNFDRYNPATSTMSWDPRWRTFRHSEIIQEKHYEYTNEGPHSDSTVFEAAR